MKTYLSIYNRDPLNSIPVLWQIFNFILTYFR